MTRLLVSPPINNDLLYTKQITLIPESGHVEFKEPVFFKDAIDGNIPAVIRLRTSFPLKDTESGARLCQQFWATPNSSISANVVKLLKQSDIGFRYLSRNGARVRSSAVDLVSNESSFKFAAASAIAGEMDKYAIGTGYSAPYKGFVFDYQVDGIIRAIVYDVSANGEGTTHIDFNMERPEAYLTLNELHGRRMATYKLWYDAQQQSKLDRKVNPSGTGKF
jgi:hypothetical protein